MVFSNSSSTLAAVGQAQHVAHLRGIDHAAAMGDRLVEQRSPSRTEPSAARAINVNASGEISTFSVPAISANCRSAPRAARA